MPKLLPAGLSLLLLIGALVYWRTRAVPPPTVLGLLCLAIALAGRSLEDQAPTVSTILFYVSLALAIASVWLRWRWRRVHTP